eukprot:jgi/Botrbrau1/23528/Bobra.0517s0001.1
MHKTFLGISHGNVAHGNVVGVSFYKNGYRAPNGVVLRNITAYKNIESGIRIHGSHNIILENTIVSDSRLGVDFAWKGNETLQKFHNYELYRQLWESRELFAQQVGARMCAIKRVMQPRLPISAPSRTFRERDGERSPGTLLNWHQNLRAVLA